MRLYCASRCRPQQIFVTGNTKFDQTYAEVTPEDLAKYRFELGLKEDYPIIVAGSTHPGEEKVLFESFKCIREKYPHARLLSHRVKLPERRKLPSWQAITAMKQASVPRCWRKVVSARNTFADY